ncbi:hypothetical protein BUALT_Bualt01G0023800 [Buddleja alternifolia]|uniref:Uncharacterized protein n=1 Tax=Buddleja alternifolia TaxID=168488 RepID=A0AAV6YAV0_9LAMI|nr:hypothetical protein BUALT_Bualt01G0023800 [Buddleja alternifolia]
MKQSTSTSSSKQGTIFDSATEDELSVAEILLELNVLMSLSESLKNFNWSSTRRRSALDAPPPLSPAPSISRTDDGIEDVRPSIKPEDGKSGAATTSTTGSPDTPLVFPSSESEHNSKHSPKTSSKKRSKEEYMDMIEKLSQNREVLRGEVEKVKKHYNSLKAYNSQLKAFKQEVLKARPNEEFNLGTELAQSSQITAEPHHPPSITDQTSQNLQNSFGPITAHLQSSNNRPEPVNHVGPSGIDLNISAEESLGVDGSQPFDEIRALAVERVRSAEARRRRIDKIKSTRGACGIKLPRTKE